MAIRSATGTRRGTPMRAAPSTAPGRRAAPTPSRAAAAGSRPRRPCATWRGRARNKSPGSPPSCPAKAGHPVLPDIAIEATNCPRILSVITGSPAFAGDDVRALGKATRMSTAFVTGTSTGIGQVIAFALARAGYDLAVTELDTDTLGATLRHPDLKDRKVFPVRFDLREQDSIEQAFDAAVEKLGAIDLL